MTVTRRHLQIALGLLWLLDGILQLQPFMFTTGFAQQILAPAGDGQTGWVAGPVRYFAELSAQHPVLLNSGAAGFQLALGGAFLFRRSVRAAIIASIGWSIGIWWFGEGLGGLASGHATLVTGAPGAAILYAVLAAGCWPHHHRETPARGLDWAWVAIWVGGALLQLLPAQRDPNALSHQIRDSANGAPGWLAAIDRAAAGLVTHAGPGGLVFVTSALAAIGLGALVPGRTRIAATSTGAAMAALFWLVGQNLGQLYTGHATDPNSGVLLILFAAAVAAPAASRSPALDRHTATRPRPAPAHPIPALRPRQPTLTKI